MKSTIRFDKDLEIKDAQKRHAVQLNLIGICERLHGIKQDTPDMELILHRKIAETQDAIGRLIFFVEGVNIDTWPITETGRFVVGEN